MHNWHCHSLAKLTSPTNVTVVLHCVRLACGRAIPEYVVPRINVCVSQMREFMRFIKCTQGLNVNNTSQNLAQASKGSSQGRSNYND